MQIPVCLSWTLNFSGDCTRGPSRNVCVPCSRSNVAKGGRVKAEEGRKRVERVDVEQKWEDGEAYTERWINIYGS